MRLLAPILALLALAPLAMADHRYEIPFELRGAGTAHQGDAQAPLEIRIAGSYYWRWCWGSEIPWPIGGRITTTIGETTTTHEPYHFGMLGQDAGVTGQPLVAAWELSFSEWYDAYPLDLAVASAAERATFAGIGELDGWSLDYTGEGSWGHGAIPQPPVAAQTC